MSKMILNRIKVTDNCYLNQISIVHIWYRFMSSFGANYVIFWRKNHRLMSSFGANYVIFWRKLCHLLAQGNFTSNLKSINYDDFIFLINNLKNNLTNYSDKLFKEERGTSKKVFGLFGRPLFPLEHLSIEKELSHITSSMV